MPLIDRTFSDIITFTRTGTTATYFNSAGVLTTTVADEPRFDYDPSTLAPLGFLIEEQRTNSIRNNTMQGAVAGTPGTLPQVSGVPSWNVSGLGTLNQQVVAVSTINGINYIDLRFSGTTSTTQLSIRLEPGGTGSIAAANGQTWSMSLWSAIIAGGLTNINSYGYGTLVYDAVGFFIGAPFGNGTINTTSTLTRTQATGTIAIVGTAFIQPQIYFLFNSGVAIDITLRIGLPQLEQGAFATSVIPTTTTALTRSADVASVNTLSPWYNSTSGTLYAEVSAAAGFNATGSFGRYAGIQDALNNNSVEIFWDGNANLAPRYRVRSGGANQALGSSVTAYTASTVLKSALGYQVDSFAGVSRGVVDLTDTSGAVPVSPTLLSLGSEGGTINYLNGWLRRVTYYKRRLSNAQLQAITQ